jgi:hypothetical protein
MRADRDEVPFNEERRGTYGILAAGGGIVILALLLYFGLRDPAELPATPQQVIRDGGVVAPAVTPTAEAPLAPAARDTANFSERQLAPPTPTVGAGAAAVTNREDAEREALIINGELLEELEEDAAATPAPQAP